jgi:hypothetical protein
MVVKGITPDQFACVVRDVSNTRYDGNVRVDWGEWGPALLNQAGTRFRGRVLVYSSRGKGARRSWSGRRLAAACWHVFRDVVREALARYPDAVITTSMARYTAENFESTYPATGEVNVGSMFEPAYLPDLCECDDAEWTVTVPRACPTVPAREADTGSCGWCGKPTGSDAMPWCSDVCQAYWQVLYAAPEPSK